MNLTIIDDNGTSYSFPQTFVVKRPPLSANTNMTKFIFADGGKQTGDGKYNYRIVTVEGVLIEDTTLALETAWQALNFAASKGGALRLVGDVVNRYIDVRSPDFDCEDGIYGTSLKVTLTFIAAYPFWVDVDETSDVNVLAGNGSFTVDASGAASLLLPVIQISADQGVDVPSVKLVNTNDGGLSFIYNNPVFYAGSVLTIDCQAGTIRLNNNNAVEYLQANSALPRLQPMINTFNFEGAACTVTVKYRKVYK